MKYRVLKTYTQPNLGQVGVGSVSLVEYADGTRRWVEHNAVNLHGQASRAAMGATGAAGRASTERSVPTAVIAAGVFAVAYILFRA